MIEQPFIRLPYGSTFLYVNPYCIAAIFTEQSWTVVRTMDGHSFAVMEPAEVVLGKINEVCQPERYEIQECQHGFTDHGGPVVEQGQAEPGDGAA